MSHLLDDDDDDLHGRQNHRELTLSTGSILGIFFGLVLLCAMFFAFGYNMGHRSAPPPVVAASDTSDTPSTAANFSSFKPPAGSAATHAPVANHPVSVPVSAPTESDDSTDSAPAVSTPAPAVVKTTPVAPAPVLKPVAAPEPAPATNHPTPPPPNPPASATGTIVVQIAAVSHQEDANLLVGALQRKGYAVAARSVAQDRLIHIQVGPFNNRKDADAMRQRLLSDGYNAIIK
jgi:DedD protein